MEALADLGQNSKAGGQGEPPLDRVAIREFASQIAGRVITPEAPEYESSRLVFNSAFDKRPALIVRCAGATDIARALDFAQQHGLTVAVRGGGHNRAGLSICDGGVVIDLSAMSRIEVNPARRVARAEAGALTIHVDSARRSATA
jgi:FAD/FMN-containing dehydrogenase